ncbi:T9SS type A sorting domain-containing protein [Brumimicrobium mesophilum]|uniref:T9SS type A sorting domain-containing protein n=1 Tax=Brumimicrobium mesophilum TaxID=392717 RepID=UPI000D141865|nr:T9SS type A sorting domain-containing protein [Brumimicrobium mesophilum]
MKKTLLLLVSHLFLSSLFAQTATDLIDLETPKLDESSGLLFYNNKVITFNDSEGEAELYEIDINSGNISRTIIINNAINTDWEDIAQDNDFIYIGDFGNNTGDRTDLKIYKISKTDYDDASNTADAEIINFSYADQTDFTINATTNFDAEGLISIGNNLIIFSKNWGDNMVKAYSIPKTIGTHSAILESTYDVNGLISGAEISSDEKTIFLTGYSSSSAPFMYTINNIPNASLDVFSGNVSNKIINIVPFGNIIEGVALFEVTSSEYRLYLTNEKFIATAGPITVPFPAKLWSIEIEDESLSITQNDLSSMVTVYPNPVNNLIKLSDKVDAVKIYNSYGKLIIMDELTSEVAVDDLVKGVYFIHLNINNTIVIQKIIKN